MKIDSYSQYVYTPEEVFETLMENIEKNKKPGPFLITNVGTGIDIEKSNNLLGYKAFENYKPSTKSLEEFDKEKQQIWFMPKFYKEMDIAAYVLSLCKTTKELERCGQELILYQDRNLFDLLRYLTYLVDVMTKNKIIWGVGRGSSVSSYVLYKLKVHKIDSLFYDLSIEEFLR